MSKKTFYIVIGIMVVIIIFITLSKWLSEVNYRGLMQETIPEMGADYFRLAEKIKNSPSEKDFQEYCSNNKSVFLPIITKLSSIKIPSKFTESHTKIYHAAVLFNECNQNICQGFTGDFNDEAKAIISKGISQCGDGLVEMMEGKNLSELEIKNKSFWEIITSK